MSRHESVVSCYGIPGETWPAELCWLFDNLSGSKSHAEIGVYCGRSLFASCGGMRDSEVFVVDSNVGDSSQSPGPKWITSVRQATLVSIAQQYPNVRVEHLQMPSLEAAMMLFKRGVMLDSVFIDASHHYEHVSADIQAWRALVKPGGLICGHDYWPPDAGVMRAVNEEFDRFDVVQNTRIWVARV